MADNPMMPPEAPHAERPITSETRGLRHADEVTPRLPARRKAGPAGVRRGGRVAAYDALVVDYKQRYKVAIRKWRRQMAGAAYELQYRDGRIKRLITAPRPRSPVSAAIFLHEIGHHAVGFHRYRSRCLEEFYVWQWAFREMTVRNIPVDERVLRHYRRSMQHYIRLARQEREHIPHELHGFLAATN